MVNWQGKGASRMRGQIRARPDRLSVLASFWLGVFLVVLGTAAILMPRASTVAVNVVIGWLLLLSGAVYGWSALSMHGGWRIAGIVALAALSIFVGLLLLVFLLRGAITMTLVMSVFFFVSGAAKLYGAMRNRHIRGWWWGLISGVTSVIIAWFSPVGRIPEHGLSVC